MVFYRYGHLLLALNMTGFLILIVLSPLFQTSNFYLECTIHHNLLTVSGITKHLIPVLGITLIPFLIPVSGYFIVIFAWQIQVLLSVN